jgi:hypothetical protein
MPATDPHLPEESPAEPRQHRVDLPAWGSVLDANVFGQLVIPVAEQVTHVIRTSARERARGAGNALDGHSLFVQEKIAFLCAVMDNRYEVAVRDWALAEQIMAMSKQTRQLVVNTGKMEQAARDEAAIAKHVKLLQASDEFEELKASMTVLRVARRIHKLVLDAGSMDMWDLRRALAARDRGVYLEALDEAEVQDWVRKQGLIVSLGTKRP